MEKSHEIMSFLLLSQSISLLNSLLNSNFVKLTAFQGESFILDHICITYVSKLSGIAGLLLNF